MSKIRIDKLLLDRGLVPSRERAQSFIMAGCVLVNDKPVTKCGALVDTAANIRVTGQDHPYVGRGGVKLAHALKEFAIDVKGKTCIDVGASTGGFTDCLLQNGAAKVFAIDVGYGQLDWKLRNDPRVVVMERVNIRNINPPAPPFDKGGIISVPPFCKGGIISAPPFDKGGKGGITEVAVIDVSFISLTKVFPSVNKLLDAEGTIVALIKPQFEAGRGKVGKGGVVRDEAVREECVKNVKAAAQALHWQFKGITTSPITGADGNVEFLAWWVK